MNLFLLLWISIAYAKSPVLYEGRTGAVSELDVNSFSKHVNQTGTEWLVVFYAHWCGHCVAFAPEYIHVAESYKGGVLRFGAVDCANHNEALCNANDVKAYPAIVLFADGVKKEEIAADKWKDSIRSLVGDDFLNSEIKQVEAGSSLIEHDRDWTSSQLVADASLAMRLILMKEVFRGSATDLTEAEVVDLKHLLSVCESVHLSPSTRRGCAALLEEISTSTIGKSEYISLVRKYVWDEMDDEFETCKDFSCGMWRLLHVISFGSSDSLRADEPEQSMKAIRFIVDKYFSCRVCREHFLSHFDACDFQRPCDSATQDSVVEWLWRLHNGVNLRLGKAEQDRSVIDMYAGHQQYFDRTPYILFLISLGALVLYAMYRMADARFIVSKIKSQVDKKYHPIV